MGEERINQTTPESQPVSSIEELPAQLGFIETPELTQLRNETVEAVRSGNWPLIHRLRDKYMRMAEATVVQPHGEDSQRCGIGFTITNALIMKEGGRLENYEAELQNAHLHAWNLGYLDIINVIESALAEIGAEAEFRPYLPSQEKPKRQLSEAYLVELQQLSDSFGEIQEPLEVSLDENHLLVDGRSLEASDGPELLWHALTGGREKISEGLQHYRETMQASHPDKEISSDTPLRVMYLANHPRDVLSPTGMEKIDHFVREFHDIDDVKEEFQELWKTIDASGWLAEIRIFANRAGWQPIYLWARAAEAPTGEE